MSSYNANKSRVKALVAEHSEILKVREDFYKRSGSRLTLAEPERLKAAIQSVELWIDRGSISHAIAATAELCKAITTSGPDSSPTLYALALSNFVTGYTDSQQNLKRKISMFDIGKSIGLPAAYIAMRHDIVHGQMPSLIELRRFVVRALKWLWEDYWRHMDPPTASNPPKNVVLVADATTRTASPDGISHEMEAIVHRYHEQTISRQPKSTRTNISTSHMYQMAACRVTTQKLCRICDRSIGHIELLVSILLRSGRLLPEPGSHDCHILIYPWWALIEAMSRKSMRFQTALITKMVEMLALSSVQGKGLPYPHSTALKCWLDYILHKGGSSTSPSAISVQTVLNTCLAYPGPYTTSCVLQIYKSGYCTDNDLKNERLGELLSWATGNAPLEVDISLPSVRDRHESSDTIGNSESHDTKAVKLPDGKVSEPSVLPLIVLPTPIGKSAIATNGRGNGS
ncbi:MAG: rRNA-processing protein las1 [Stictis urceolatum]|nr:rRNA-processing protein las1 [Stictis urceolata]